MAPRGLLFSSPARMARNDAILIVSSSPEFPSILELATKAPKNPALRSGSNAAPIPENAIRAFTTAASVWRFGQTDEGERNQEENLIDARKNHPDPTTGAQSASNSVIELSPAPAPSPKASAVPKKPRKVATTSKKKEEIPIEQDEGASVTALGYALQGASSATVTVPAEMPKRKPRAAKAAKEAGDDVQTTLPKGKVTKPPAKEKVAKTAAKPAATEKRPRKKVETISSHFATEPPAPKTSPKPIVTNEPIGLEPAMRRRTEWTPPPENAPLPSQAHPSSAGEEQIQPAGADASGRDVFKNLLDTYGCHADNPQPGEATGAQPSNDILGKRKLIEMVPTSVNKAETPQISPVKSRAPKKKLRTITDLATEAYRVSEPCETPGPKHDSVLDYFEVEGKQPDNASKGLDNTGKAKAPKKAAKPKVSKKKAEPRKQILLSPTSALRQVSVQDFVFGTVSQLATEEDLDLLRALHEAMKESNQVDDDPFRASSPVISDLAAGRTRAGKKHWAAGARDDDGDLLDLEVFDLTESPAATQDYTLPTISADLSTVDLTDSPAVLRDIGQTSIEHATVAAKEKAPPPPALYHDIEILSSDYNTLDLADSPRISSFKSHFVSTQKARVLPNQPGPSTAIKLQEAPRPSAVVELNFDLDFEPPPSNQEHNQLIAQSQSPSNMSPVPRVQGLPKPKFELFTDAQLAKEIKSYGFKAVKRRSAMVALLEQCWESKNKTALGNPMAVPSVSSASVSSKAAAAAAAPAPAVSPSRLRGRPRKTSSTATVPVAKSPTRPRGRPKKDTAAASPSKVSKAKAPSVTKPIASTPKRRKAATQPLVEIADSGSDSDSDNPFASSPMSTASSQDRHRVFSPSPDDLSISEDTEMSLLMSPSDQQEALFGHITRAVTTAPPTTDPAEPSWHEKMLMYDPVILEDLAAWLNAGQLDRVGFDGEVAPADVKKWCESQSVCCLWRVNLRGKGRKRF